MPRAGATNPANVVASPSFSGRYSRLYGAASPATFRRISASIPSFSSFPVSSFPPTVSVWSLRCSGSTSW
jgi:hypothetical protein